MDSPLELEDIPLEHFGDEESGDTIFKYSIFLAIMLAVAFFCSKSPCKPIYHCQRFVNAIVRKNPYAQTAIFNITNKDNINLNLSISGIFSNRVEMDDYIVRYNKSYIMKKKKKVIKQDAQLEMVTKEIKFFNDSTYSAPIPFYTNINESFTSMLINMTVHTNFEKIGSIGIDIVSNHPQSRLYNRYFFSLSFMAGVILFSWSLFEDSIYRWYLLTAEVVYSFGAFLIGEHANLPFSLLAVSSAIATFAIVRDQGYLITNIICALLVASGGTAVMYLTFIQGIILGITITCIVFIVLFTTGSMNDRSLVAIIACASVFLRAPHVATALSLMVLLIFMYVEAGNLILPAFLFLAFSTGTIMIRTTPISARGYVVPVDLFRPSFPYGSDWWQSAGDGRFLDRVGGLEGCRGCRNNANTSTTGNGRDLILGYDPGDGSSLVNFVRTARDVGFGGHIAAMMPKLPLISNTSRRLLLDCGVDVVSIGKLPEGAGTAAWLFALHDFLRANGEMFDRVLFVNSTSTVFERNPLAEGVSNESVYLTQWDGKMSVTAVWGGSDALFRFAQGIIAQIDAAKPEEADIPAILKDLCQKEDQVKVNLVDLNIDGKSNATKYLDSEQTIIHNYSEEYAASINSACSTSQAE